jgi:hypothetical protein
MAIVTVEAHPADGGRESTCRDDQALGVDAVLTGDRPGRIGEHRFPSLEVRTIGDVDEHLIT